MAERKESSPKKGRRSGRRELAIPIRVFGTSVRGRDFSEDCVSLRVSPHGALIRLRHSLIVDDTIRIMNLKTKKEAPFRVVGLAHNPPNEPYSDWGVEAVDPGQNIWIE